MTRKKGMRLVLLTTTGCPPCDGAKDALRQYISRGEIEVGNIQESNEAADLALQGHFNAMPHLVVVDKKGGIFAELPISEEG